MQKNEVVHLLQGSQAAIAALLGSLTASAACWKPAPGEWSIQEALGHLIETERRSFAGRIREILASPDSQLADWDQEVVARERNDFGQELHMLLLEFAALRTGSVALAGSLQPDDLARQGRHPQIGSVSVTDLLHEWVYHDCDHLRQMQANLQAYVWPAMGSTQKFYLPANRLID